MAKGPHRLSHVENPAAMERFLNSFAKGDVVVRSGTPHMVVEVSNVDGQGNLDPLDGRVWLVNLVSGSCSPYQGLEKVWPASDVELTFGSMRRG